MLFMTIVMFRRDTEGNEIEEARGTVQEFLDANAEDEEVTDAINRLRGDDPPAFVVCGPFLLQREG